MSLTQFCGQEIGQFDLADFALNLEVGHLGIEIMLKPVLAQELNKQLLCQIRVGTTPAFLDEQARATRRSYQGMVRHDSMEF